MDLWEVINDGPVEAWGSTKGDDRKGELNPGDVIDILDAYPADAVKWLQFEPYSGGADLVPHSESPYSEYWVKRGEVELRRPNIDEPAGPTDAELARWVRDTKRLLDYFLGPTA